jgi:hypothetical protein
MAWISFVQNVLLEQKGSFQAPWKEREMTGAYMAWVIAISFRAEGRNPRQKVFYFVQF